jgi:hypothetical protein
MRLLALASQDLVVLLRKFPRLRRRIQKSSTQRLRKPKKRQASDEPISPGTSTAADAVREIG